MELNNRSTSFCTSPQSRRCSLGIAVTPLLLPASTKMAEDEKPTEPETDKNDLHILKVFILKYTISIFISTYCPSLPVLLTCRIVFVCSVYIAEILSTNGWTFPENRLGRCFISCDNFLFSFCCVNMSLFSFTIHHGDWWLIRICLPMGFKASRYSKPGQQGGEMMFPVANISWNTTGFRKKSTCINCFNAYNMHIIYHIIKIHLNLFSYTMLIL